MIIIDMCLPHVNKLKHVIINVTTFDEIVKGHEIKSVSEK